MSKPSKTNKSFSKRLKLTRKGKILARKAGHGHFNAKESRRKNLKKQSTQTFRMSNKDISREFPNK